jgi:hypothetical protein
MSVTVDPFTVMRTCTGPYRFSIVEPTYCFVAFDDPVDVGGGAAPAGGDVVDGETTRPDDGAVATPGAGLVWNDAIRKSPTAVASRAGASAALAQ